MFLDTEVNSPLKQQQQFGKSDELAHHSTLLVHEDQ